MPSLHASQAYEDVILATPGLRGYWRLGDAAGTVVRDRWGSNNGTYSGTFTLDQAGALAGDNDKSVDLVGTGYVSMTQAVLPLRISMEVWLNSTTFDPASPNRDCALMGQWNGTSGVLFYTTANSGGSDPSVRLFVLGNLLTVTISPALNVWHHYVATYDGTNGRIYIDGALVAGPTSLAGPITSPAVAFQMGAYNASTGSRFKGRLDEGAYYNVALTQAQILAHYRAGLGYG